MEAAAGSGLGGRQHSAGQQRRHTRRACSDGELGPWRREDTPKTVTIAAGGSALPGRDLTFAINASKNSVTVEVAVDDGAGSDYVEVDNLVFTAHFLSLEA